MNRRANVRSTSVASTAAILLALMLTAGFFALFFIPQSLRLDESQSLWETSRSPQAILTTVAQDVHVPLYHELLHAWRNTVGDSVTSSRSLSLLFFLAAIPLLYLLGASLYGRTAALFATLLFTLSPFMNWYASEIRMYTLFVLMAILHQYFYVRLFKKESDGAWVGYLITAVIGVYVHYFFFLILFTEAFFFLMHRSLFQPHALKRFIATAFVVILSFAPWVWYVIHEGQAQNQQPSLPVPTSINLFGVFSQFLLGFQTDPVNTVFLSLWPLVIILVFLALRKRTYAEPETEFLVISIVVPVTLAFAISFFVPLFVSRYLIFVAPALYLLIAYVFSRYPGRGRVVASGVLALLMSLMLAVEVTSAATPVKEDYRDVVSYLSATAHAQDAIIVSAPFTIYPIEYYYRGTAPLLTLPEWNRYAHGAIPGFDPSTLASQVATETAGVNYAWLVLSYNQGYQQQIQDYFDRHYARVYAHTFSSGLTVYGYKVRYDTPLAQLPLSTTTIPEATTAP
jgi:mannosyltransferase